MAWMKIKITIPISYQFTSMISNDHNIQETDFIILLFNLVSKFK